MLAIVCVSAKVISKNCGFLIIKSSSPPLILSSLSCTLIGLLLLLLPNRTHYHLARTTPNFKGHITFLRACGGHVIFIPPFFLFGVPCRWHRLCALSTTHRPWRHPVSRGNHTAMDAICSITPLDSTTNLLQAAATTAVEVVHVVLYAAHSE